MLVQGKEVKRRDSNAGLVSQAATSSPLASITPLYMLAIAGLQTPTHTQTLRNTIQLWSPQLLATCHTQATQLRLTDDSVA